MALTVVITILSVLVIAECAVRGKTGTSKRDF
jgi:hypothetical protein